MLNQLNEDPITNQEKFPEQIQTLVQEIEYEVHSLISKMILKAHDRTSYGLKFIPDSNDLDYAIHQRVLRNGLQSTVEQVLEDVDDLKSYY